MSCKDPRIGWCMDIQACPDCSARLKANQERQKEEETRRFAQHQANVDAALAPLLESPVRDVRVSYSYGQLSSVVIELADGREVPFSVSGDMYDYCLSVGEEMDE